MESFGFQSNCRSSFDMDNGSVNSNEHTIDPEFLLQCKKGFYAPLEPLYIWPDTGLPLRGRWSYDANLEANYSAAYRDFCGFPSLPPCIYKSGPIWPEREPPEAYRYIREPRPVYDHPISDRWERIGTQIYELLDSHDVKWTSIDPIAIANTDMNIEDMPFFCPFLLWIGVKQDTLAFHHAVSAAAAIKDTILSPAGFPEIEVAFRVSEVTFYATGSGPKLRPPESIETWLPDRVVEATKPFTPTLGLSLASLRTPYYEGTGALYFRLKFRENDNKPPGEHVVILTAAHVARPPAVYHNTGLEPSEIRRTDLGPSNDMVALGYSAYEKAIQTIMRMISHSHSNIQRKRRTIAKLGDKMEGEPSNTTDVRQDCQVKIEEETKTISRLNTLHDEVTKRRTSTSQRVVGRVVYASSIGADETTRYTRDWALIMLDKDMIDWENFPGNQIHIAHSFSLLTLSDAYISPLDYCRWMFQRREGTAGDSEAADSDGTDNGLLRVSGVAEHDEIFHAQDTDHKGQKVILVVKNGMATGTTIGCVNGLKSFTRIDMPECGIVKKTSLEVAILPYNPFRSFTEGMRRQVAFSAPGDSGAIVLDGRGRAVAMLNGGAGNAAAGETDISYGTPFCWLEKQIKETFPDCRLYD